MKHYTLPEHRTFCIESGINVKSEWMEVGKLGWLPEGIYHAPNQAFNPEIKLKQRKRQKDYSSIPENKAKKKEYNRKYHSTPENNKRQRELYSTPEYKARKKEYDRKYHSTPEYKAKRQALAAHTKRYRRNMK